MQTTGIKNKLISQPTRRAFKVVPQSVHKFATFSPQKISSLNLGPIFAKKNLKITSQMS
jgi:hypothetical protein